VLQEFCDGGDLREHIDKGLFAAGDGKPASLARRMDNILQASSPVGCLVCWVS